MTHTSLNFFFFFDVFVHFFMHNSLRIPPQCFSQLELRTLTGQLQHCDSFLCWPFCCRFITVFGINVRQMVSHLPLEFFGIQRASWSTEGLLNVLNVAHHGQTSPRWCHLSKTHLFKSNFANSAIKASA